MARMQDGGKRLKKSLDVLTVSLAFVFTPSVIQDNTRARQSAKETTKPPLHGRPINSSRPENGNKVWITVLPFQLSSSAVNVKQF